MTASGESPGISSRRLKSLDALRGFDMLWIVGLAQIFREWAKVDDAAWLKGMTEQLTHVEWAGLHAYDLIFPTFMFLSGISIPFAMAGKTGKGASRGQLFAGILRRVLILVFLGAVYNGLLKLDFAHQRWASVLGQIGLAYGIAATTFIFTKSWKGRAMVCGFILVLIPVLQLLVPVPGHGAGVLTQEGILNAWFDRKFLPGRLNGEVFDPEGILCIVSAAALTLCGVLTGGFLKSRGDQPRLTTVPILIAAGAVLVLAGWACWHMGYPPIKSAWNTTFNFFAAGIGLGVFAVFHLLIDFTPRFNWSLPLQVVGMNPLTIYLGNRIVPFAGISTFLFGGVAARSGKWEAVVLAVGLLLIEWLILGFLYRKKAFLRV
jgi:predicted acyltransferase